MTNKNIENAQKIMAQVKEVNEESTLVAMPTETITVVNLTTMEESAAPTNEESTMQAGTNNEVFAKLATLKLSQLRTLAGKKGLKGVSKMKATELKEVLKDKITVEEINEVTTTNAPKKEQKTVQAGDEEKGFDFKVIAPKLHYNPALLKDENNADSLREVVTMLIREGELSVAQAKINQYNNTINDYATKNHVLVVNETTRIVALKDKYNDFLYQKALADYLTIELLEMAWTRKDFEELTEYDRLICLLLALPNMPKYFAKSIECKHLDIKAITKCASDFFAGKDINQAINDTMAQLNYNLYFTKIDAGNVFFNSCRVKINKTSTIKFLSLFNKGLKQMSDGKFDFDMIYNHKNVDTEVAQLLNLLFAYYIGDKTDMLEVTPFDELNK